MLSSCTHSDFVGCFDTARLLEIIIYERRSKFMVVWSQKMKALSAVRAETIAFAKVAVKAKYLRAIPKFC